MICEAKVIANLVKMAREDVKRAFKGLITYLRPEYVFIVPTVIG